MATNASKTPLLRLLAKKSFATSAKPAAVSPASNIQVSTLPNKCVVASADSVIPGIVKVSVAFGAGSRYEREENLGASHMLRASCGLSTNSATQFGITRNLQHLGAGLSATSCREAVVYTMESTSNQVDKVLPFLKTIAVEQAFKPWELRDNIPRIQNELNSLPPQAVLIDLVHFAAYRKNLGNSMFVKEHMIKKICPETLQHFVNENFKSSKATVCGVGLPHQELADFATSLDLQSGSGESSGPAKYFGGEVRKETGGDNSYIMIACESSSLQKKEVFAWSILAYALGSSARVKYGTGAGPLGKASSNVPSTSISAVHIPHSDSGLMGIVISSHSAYSGPAVENVSKVLKSGTISDADVARGKAILKQEILGAGDSVNGLLAEMTYQSLLVGSISTPGQLATAIDGISTQQVQEVMKKFSSSKKSLAALGSIHNTPYLDQIM